MIALPAPRITGTATDEAALAGAGGRLLVDLAALAANYRDLARVAAPAACAAVVKADAYGIGAADAVPALLAAGCRIFFVADVGEAAAIAPLLPASCALYVLGGVHPGSGIAYDAIGALPVLNSLPQARRWQAWSEAAGSPRPAAVQVDTGMSRLGMSADGLRSLATDAAFRRAVPLALVMSHLACADHPEAPANREQLQAFLAATACLPNVPRSLANSAGAFIAGDYRLDLVRTGIALYGGAAVAGGTAMRPVVTLEARVAQVRSVAPGTGIGYGHAFRATSRRRIATLAVGYADGWPRALGNRGAAWHRGRRLPIVGRVSMDSMTIDVTASGDGAPGEGDWVELIGPHQPVDAVADDAGTIAYEILTNLGRRYHRRVVGTGPAGPQVAA